MVLRIIAGYSMNFREDNRFHVGSSQAISLLSALRSVGHVLDCHSRQLMRSCGLSLPQLLVLNAAHRCAPARMPAQESAQQPARDHSRAAADTYPCIQDLVEALNLHQGTVTDIVGRLESRGYLQRRRDHRDRRRQLITLTASGTTALAEAPSLIPPEFVAHFADQPEARLRVLVDTLNEIASAGQSNQTATGEH